MHEVLQKYLDIIVLATSAIAGWFTNVLFLKFRKAEEQQKMTVSEVDTIERLLKTVRELAIELDALHRDHTEMKARLQHTEQMLIEKDAQIQKLQNELNNFKTKWTESRS